MKTTLDLDDVLQIEAKIAAARRRTTPKAMVEHALRRELAPLAADAAPSFSWPVLPRSSRENPNAELHRRLAEGDVADTVAWLEHLPETTARRRGG